MYPPTDQLFRHRTGQNCLAHHDNIPRRSPSVNAGIRFVVRNADKVAEGDDGEKKKVKRVMQDRAQLRSMELSLKIGSVSTTEPLPLAY